MVHGIWMQTLLNTESQWTVTEGVGPKNSEEMRKAKANTIAYQIMANNID